MLVALVLALVPGDTEDFVVRSYLKYSAGNSLLYVLSDDAASQVLTEVKVQ
jgi:hypothetical protein